MVTGPDGINVVLGLDGEIVIGVFVGVEVVITAQLEQVHKLFDCEMLEQ